MSKLIKWLLGSLVTLVVVVIALIIIVPMVVDPNDYREDISNLVKEKTGRELEFDGELSVSVFPWAGIVTNGVSLSQPSEIGNDNGPMLSMDEAQLRVKLLPLISKRVEIDTIVLKKPIVNLITLANGTSSLSGLTAESDAADESSASTQEDQANASQAGGAALAIVVQGVNLEDANILWDDQQAKQSYRLNNLNLQTGNLLGSSLADLKLSGSFVDASQADAIDFKLSAKAKVDAQTLKATIKDIDANVKQGDLGTSLLIAGLNASSEQIDLSGLESQFEFQNRPFTLAMPELSVNLDKQTAQLASLTIKSLDANVLLENLQAKKIIDNPSATGKLVVSSFDVKKLINDLNIDYQASSDNALQAVSLSTEFSGGMDSVSLNELNVGIDESTLSGSLSVANFEKPRAKFKLALDSLNIDNYLPIAEDTDQVEDAEEVSGVEALAVPMAVFKDIHANGSFKVGQLIASNLTLSDIELLVESTPGKVSITPKLNLYDGSSSGSVVYTEKGKGAQLHLKNSVTKVNLGDLLTAADVSDQLSGTGSLDIDVTVVEKGGKQSNSGSVKLLAKDGALKGVNIKAILDKAQSAYNSLKGKKSEETAEAGDSKDSDETRFAELSGTFDINDFMVNNNDLVMKAPLFRVSGNGDIDLGKEVLDYLVSVTVVNTSQGQGGESLDKLKGLTIPVRFKGKLDSPSYTLDMKALYKAEAARKVNEKKEVYLKEKLGIEGGGEMSTKDIFKGFLNKKLNK